jgi:predicted AAA+ superfamily ATPase
LTILLSIFIIKRVSLRSKNFKVANFMSRYIIRVNEKFLFESFKRHYVSAILGPRRVGKTTLCEYFESLHPHFLWVRLNMDVLSQRNRVANEELKLMIEQSALQKIGGPKKIWVFIDEAQKCPELFDQVKLIYDAHKGKDHVKFILTGSAHLNLHQLTAESLAGRVDLLHLREFTLKEMTLLQHENLSLPNESAFDIIFNSKDHIKLKAIFSELRPFQLLFQKSLEEYLIWGGLPETVQETSDHYRLKYLGDYLQTYLEKDIRAIETISDLHLYQNLMKICAELTGSLRDDKKIIDALHCSRNTLLKYRDYLLATLQYIEVYPFIESTVKRLVKSPKGYLTNNGLISYLTGIHDLKILKTTGLIGHRFENWFLNEIQTWLDTSVERHNITFWRTPGDAEVDFVVAFANQIIPFEITYSTLVSTKKITNLKRFMKNTSNVNFGIFCYTGDFKFDEENRILYLPAWMI